MNLKQVVEEMKTLDPNSLAFKLLQDKLREEITIRQMFEFIGIFDADTDGLTPLLEALFNAAGIDWDEKGLIVFDAGADLQSDLVVELTQFGALARSIVAKLKQLKA